MSDQFWFSGFDFTIIKFDILGWSERSWHYKRICELSNLTVCWYSVIFRLFLKIVLWIWHVIGKITCYILPIDCLSIACRLPLMHICSTIVDMTWGTAAFGPWARVPSPYPLWLDICASRAVNRPSIGIQYGICTYIIYMYMWTYEYYPFLATLDSAQNHLQINRNKLVRGICSQAQIICKCVRSTV